MARPEDPRHQQITPIKVGVDEWYDFRHTKPENLSGALKAAIDPWKILCWFLQEPWQKDAEIIPNYVSRWGNVNDKPKVVVRVKIHSDHPNHEPETYAFLRNWTSVVPHLIWDIYGDDFVTVENAFMALAHAPTPYYCGPSVHKIPIQK